MSRRRLLIINPGAYREALREAFLAGAASCAPDQLVRSPAYRSLLDAEFDRLYPERRPSRS